MANGSILVNNGKKIIINRAYKDTPDYEAPMQFKVGISNSTPDVGDTDLDVAIPIDAGTINDDGSNTGNLVGSAGGTTSTDNTSTYKVGGGVSDNTAQNLLANGTSVSKTWTIANLAAAGSVMTLTQPFGVWIYMDETAVYDLLAAAGTVFDIRFLTAADADVTKYYQYVRTKAQLASGWNWITSGTTIMTGLTQGAGGAPGGVLDKVILTITTALAATTFSAGECVWDLLRGWATTDLVKNYVSGYPTIDETNFEVETRCLLLSTEANGYDINGFANFNDDGTILMSGEDTFTAESKSDTDQFTFIVKDRLI
jgi:hypothetical protein